MRSENFESNILWIEFVSAELLLFSLRFLADLEVRLGERVLIGAQVGDIVLQHCPVFNSLYVPYVTNMMYQEALIIQLLYVSSL